MTTDIASLSTYAGPQLHAVAPFAPVSHQLPNGISAFDGTADAEDSSTIKCICGFDDDDGSTVLCEECNTWQHVDCYYHPHKIVPDIHECVDCHPRPLDAKGASERQRLLRELHNIGDRKVKRASSKSHKKKTKESVHGITQANGWAVHENAYYGLERTSGSPRDHGPPTKCPKTSHKASISVASVGATRKRAGSAIYNRHSPVKSPANLTVNGSMDDYFSPEFMQLHQQPDATVIDTNSYTNIGVANSLHTWLNDPESLAKVTNGMTSKDLFQRSDKPMEELELMAPGITRQKAPDTSITVHGTHPVLQWLTIDSDVPKGAYIGELRGHIGLKEEYFKDPANRWSALRHPEPFVFFPPHLPIYIDTRTEGTRLRYVRRSCQPNLTMQIIITEGRDYHFCLLAARDIHEGEEITINWDVHDSVKSRLAAYLNNGKKEGILQEDAEYISMWANGVLANLGDCACRTAACVFDRFDGRGGHPIQLLGPAQGKSSTAKKTKRAGTQISPLSTGRATNSRAGSETRTREQDDDNVDSRSTSGSSRSKPASRDITPLTHVTDAAAGLGVEFSERERKKLQQQERLFQQMEMDEQQGSKKKKRNSAGSTLNTPSLTTSRQIGFPDLPTPSLAASPDASRARNGSSVRMNGQRTVAAVSQPQPSSTRQSSGAAKPPPPLYTDSCTQTDPSDTPLPSPSSLPIRRKTQGSFVQRLLSRARETRAQREQRRPANTETIQEQSSTQDSIKAEVASPVVPEQVQEPEPNIAPILAPAPAEPQETAPEDMVMKDAEETDEPPIKPLTAPTETFTTTDPPPENLTQSSHPPIQPPPPPWPRTTPPPSAPPDRQPSPRSVPPTHVQLPPAPIFPPQHTTAESPTSSITGNPTLQSPSALSIHPPPLFSPSHAVAGLAVATPSPIKKKMSLSDYTSRKKKSAAAVPSVGAAEAGAGAGAGAAAGSPTTATSATMGSSGGAATAVQPSMPPPPAALLPSASLVEEVVAHGGLQGSAVVGTPPPPPASGAGT